MSLAVIPLYLLTQLALFLPGLALLARLSRGRKLSTNMALTLLFGAVGVLGYLAFWLYFANKMVGKSFSVGVTAISIAVLLSEIFRKKRSLEFLPQVGSPLLYMATVGSLYLALLFFVTDPFKVGQDLTDWRFFSSMQPGDNVIPWYFAEKIYHRQPLIPFCCGDWLSSDRPPLQAGIFLFYWPLRLFGSPGLNYQLVTSGLQCSWILGVWSLLSAMNLSRRRTIQVLGLLVPSAFFLYNSVYTWPKMLAATFILFAISFLITAFRERRSLTRPEMILGAICVGLAIMAHPGSVFSLPVFAVALIAKRLCRRRELVPAVLILAAFAIPWQMYQKYVDPPGNRLLKMHLAGFHGIDSRSFGQTLRDSYGGMSREQIALYKWLNVKYLIGPQPFGAFSLRPFHVQAPHLDPARLDRMRMTQKEYIWSSLGFLNLGWFAAVYLRRRSGREITYSLYLAGAAVVNLLVWSMVLFGPGQTMTTHSSYGDVLLLATALAVFLTALPGWIPLAVMLLEALNTTVVWLSFVPVSPIFVTSIQVPLLVFAIVCGAGLTIHFGRAYLTGSKAPQGAPAEAQALITG